MKTSTTLPQNTYSETIDLASFYEIVDNQEPLIISLLQILHKNLIEYPQQMTHDLAQKDFVALSELAHKFKSSTAYIGIVEFNKVLDHIEYALPNGVQHEQIEIWVRYIVEACPYLAAQVQAQIHAKGKKV
ncbi:MAG: Hpt domain-containing protein [Cytophagales bacterium]|nr:MAG: Hpt domain-containing protein [Cytophagales bacterium]TAF59896.1 MAG: Hpt domain-containing protein [Cytophagales bacterium]